MTHRGLQIRLVVAGTILFGFDALLGAVAAPIVGLPVVLAGSVLFVGVQYTLGKWLAFRRVDADPIRAEAHPGPVDRFETLADEMDLDTPRFERGRTGTPNAFAVGRKGAGVVVSEVVLNTYEEGHVGLDEIPILWFVVSYVLSILAQLLVMVFVLAISRSREYVVDADAVASTGDPDALARALAAIQQVGTSERAADVDASTAAMCLFGGKRGLLTGYSPLVPRWRSGSNGCRPGSDQQNLVGSGTTRTHGDRDASTVGVQDAQPFEGTDQAGGRRPDRRTQPPRCRGVGTRRHGELRRWGDEAAPVQAPPRGVSRLRPGRAGVGRAGRGRRARSRHRHGYTEATTLLSAR
jgi:heat shock protein HtpX